MSYLHGMRRIVEKDRELAQRKRLEWWIARHPELASRPYILAKKARVPDGVVKRFFQSLVLRNQKSLSDLEKRVVDEALKPESQHPYEGPRVKAAYWLKSDRICRQFGYKHNELGAKRVHNILEKQAGSILDKIAESVFETAYAPKSIAKWHAEFPRLYYVHVANAVGTLPETAYYVLNKKFQMPPPNFIAEIAEIYKGKNMTAGLAAEIVRGLKGGQFRNNAAPFEMVRLAKYLDGKGIAEPLKIAEGLVGYLRKNSLM